MVMLGSTPVNELEDRSRDLGTDERTNERIPTQEKTRGENDHAGQVDKPRMQARCHKLASHKSYTMIARDVMVLGMVPVSRLLFSSRSLITQAHNNKAKDAFEKKTDTEGKNRPVRRGYQACPRTGTHWMPENPDTVLGMLPTSRLWDRSSFLRPGSDTEPQSHRR